jgi:hypothetical protein
VSNVTQREQIEAETSEPTMGGTYVEKTYQGFAWRCDGCGLVWSKRHQAEGCEARGHRAGYTARYGGRVVNGVWGGGTEYPRRALRREAPPAGRPAPAPMPAPAKTLVRPHYRARPGARGRAAEAIVAQAPVSDRAAGEIRARLAGPSRTAERVRAVAAPRARLAGPA